MSDFDKNGGDNNSSAPVVPRQYLYPFVLVTALFAMWGFANDFTNPLVKLFKDIFLLSNEESGYVQTAFYGGYALMAIPAALVIRKFSFKSGIIAGLVLYATGALLMYPATMRMDFYYILPALTILTCGLAFLETSANPYILSMGDPSTATRRLNLAQSFNPMGSLIGMVIATFMVLPTLEVSKFREEQIVAHPEYAHMKPADVDPLITKALEEFTQSDPEGRVAAQAADLATIRLPYIIAGFVVLGMLVIFAVSKMPNTGHSHDPVHPLQVLRHLMHFRYVGGVIAQMFYVGAQIMCWTFIIHYGMDLHRLSAAEAQMYNIAAMAIFVTSRFICTFILRFLSPGLLLGFLAIGGGALTLATIYVQSFAGMYCLVGISACMSLMFPTIYGIALDGLSVDDAKLGSAGLIFAIVGGAIFPPLQGRVMDMGTQTIGGFELEAVRVSFFLPLGCFVVIALYGFLSAGKTPPRPAE